MGYAPLSGKLTVESFQEAISLRRDQIGLPGWRLLELIDWDSVEAPRPPSKWKQVIAPGRKRFELSLASEIVTVLGGRMDVYWRDLSEKTTANMEEIVDRFHFNDPEDRLVAVALAEYVYELGRQTGRTERRTHGR